MNDFHKNFVDDIARQSNCDALELQCKKILANGFDDGNRLYRVGDELFLSSFAIDRNGRESRTVHCVDSVAKLKSLLGF